MRIFILLFMLAPLFLWGQYPDNPRKLRLGFQTTGAGLTYIKDGAPAHTPGDDEDAWMVLDTANNVLYYWDETAGAWENILDDITQDTVFQITNVPDTTTLAPMQGDAFINASADTLGLYDGGQWRLFFGGGGAGSGTVTSVALSLPGEFAVSGSPVTTSGTLSGTWNTQAANTVLAGPASGVDAAPTFRSLVAADITAGGGALGTGSAGQVAYWSGTNTLTGSANMTYSSPLLTLGGTGASLLLTPTSAPVNAAGKWYTSSGNYPHFMNGTTDWPLVRGSAESFTPGSMLFAGTSGQAQQDNANFFWDDTNNRLGIGTTSPDGQIAAQSGDYQWVVSTNATVSSITGNQFGSVNADGSSASGRHTFFLGDASIFRSAGGVFIGDIGSEKLPSAKLNVRSGSGTLLFLAEDASNNPVLAATRSDRRVGIGTSSPQRTAHIAGDARITNLNTDASTKVVGADADGDLSAAAPGTGLAFTAGGVLYADTAFLATLTDLQEVILDKQYATFYEKELREYTLGTSPAADTVITIDTIGVAFAADSISISDGLITNDRSTTVTWLVHYDFTYNSDEDPCYSFFDLTTDGSEVPAAIAGSSAYSNQVSILGTQHPGRSFLVSVPAGQAIRLCLKGNILAATEMNISYLTITIEEK